MSTIRQQFIALLEKDAMNAREISRALRIQEKEVYEHLAHIRRSVRTRKKKLHVVPFMCKNCNFVFKDRQKMTKPGRCPKCKNGRIEGATYRIK